MLLAFGPFPLKVFSWAKLPGHQNIAHGPSHGLTSGLALFFFLEMTPLASSPVVRLRRRRMPQGGED